MKELNTSVKLRRDIAKALLLTCLSLLTTGAYAQKAKLTVAEDRMKNFDYRAATEIYMDVLSSKGNERDTLALRRLAECQMRLSDWQGAESHLRLLSADTAARLGDLHNLANVLRRQGKMDEAMDIYKLISQKDGQDVIATNYLKHPGYVSDIQKDSVLYEVWNAKVNSESSDFAPGFFVKGKVLFSSGRGLGVGSNHYYEWNEQPYLNVYVCDVTPDSTLSSDISVLENGVNTRYHEGTITYDADSNQMYLTRNNYWKGSAKKAKDGHLNLGIFSFNYSESEWDKQDAFPYNNKEYSVGHPTLVPGGKRIYFVSDMPGGHGGTDIYYCEKDSTGAWGKPKNAGALINSPGDEMFPFSVSESMLYFSSTGHLGLGGFDIFSINPLNESSTALNLGYPINTHSDDFGAITYPDETFGYFCSNRPGGKGDDDIYEFSVHPPATVEIAGRVVEKETMSPLANAEVIDLSAGGKKVSVKTDSEGKYVVQAPYSRPIMLEGSKTDYEPDTVEVATSLRQLTYTAPDLMLGKVPLLARGHVVYDVDGSPAPGSVVRLTDLNGKVMDSTLVTADGSYKIVLPENRRIILEAYKDGYVKLTKAVDTGKISGRETTHDFRLFKLEKGTVVRLDNIYYDYGKSDIRPDAALELDKLVQILKDNGTMRIELSSHTDARGGDAYNLKLSDARANSAVK